MFSLSVDVTLDPDTAHPELILSEDGKKVRHENIKQYCPDSDKRFDKYMIVLGNKGFSSGRFYFEVQVKGTTQWSLGVAKESINRKGALNLCPESGNWTLWQRNAKEYKACESTPISLSLNMKLRRWVCLWIMRKAWSPFMMWSPGLISTLSLVSLSLTNSIHV